MEKTYKIYYPILYLIITVAYILPSSSAFGSISGSRDDVTKEEKPERVDSTYIPSYIRSEQEFKHHLDLITTFYKDRNYTFAWFDGDQLVPQADKLMQAISNARKQGLNPASYSIQNLQDIQQDYLNTSSVAQKDQKKQKLDLALTASYFNYASDFYKGEIDPHSVGAIEWEVKKNKIKLNKALETILKERESTYPYYEFEAIHEGYQRLGKALVEYRRMQQQGGWPKIEGKSIVRLNDTAKVVLAIRKRLLPQQTVREQDSSQFVYDHQVEQAVTTFQEQMGLTVDGILGPQTYKALNITVDERVNQIILNMERWRWLPKNLAARNKKGQYIMVNIPAFKVWVMENDKKVMEMKAIVGETMHATPVFSHEIQYLIFAPYWNVPNSIVEDDIKPHLQRDLGWLARNDMEMVNNFGAMARRIPVSRVNWNTMTRYNFKYRIRQRPGPRNALGLVKFMFPNEYAVYLHDTPADHLFSRPERNLSHGCVRLERPAELATYLLEDKPGWDRNRVDKAMHAQKQKRVNLKENVPVYLVYFTAWVDDSGTVHFRNDIYNHDKALAREIF
jgi:L,D-transpeptidase YcbB